jgi:hypothetical protein
MNPTDWSKIEDSENDDACAAPRKGTADAFLMGGGEDPDPDDDKGPWFRAAYDGECAACFAAFFEGDLIRADGDGGWEAQECCG